MAQATQGVLDRIFARFQSKRQITQQQEPAEIDDPANPGKKIKNPKFTGQTQQTQSDDPASMFAGLFKDDASTTQDTAPRGILPRDKITEAAGKINFMDGLPKELSDALAADGGLNLENISALVNHAGRAAYSRAMEHGSQINDHFVNARIAHESKNLPSHIRTHLAKSAGRKVDGVDMDDPVVREHMDMVSERIASKFPDATEEEVGQMSQEYFTTMARKINPGAFASQGGNNVRGDGSPDNDVQDFDGYLQGTKNLEQAKAPVQTPQQGAK